MFFFGVVKYEDVMIILGGIIWMYIDCNMKEYFIFG